MIQPKLGWVPAYLFGNISDNPMEGLLKIRQVVEKDSTNVYAQMTLVKGSIDFGTIDKAINRLQTVNRLYPENHRSYLNAGRSVRKERR